MGSPFHCHDLLVFSLRFPSEFGYEEKTKIPWIRFCVDMGEAIAGVSGIVATSLERAHQPDKQAWAVVACAVGDVTSAGACESSSKLHATRHLKSLTTSGIAALILLDAVW